MTTACKQVTAKHVSHPPKECPIDTHFSEQEVEECLVMLAELLIMSQSSTQPVSDFSGPHKVTTSLEPPDEYLPLGDLLQLCDQLKQHVEADDSGGAESCINNILEVLTYFPSPGTAHRVLFSIFA